MDRIITDNSKVNENLLNEVNALNKQNKELIVKNIDLQEQLVLSGVSQQRELLIAYEKYTSQQVIGKENSRMAKSLVGLCAFLIAS